MQNSPVTPKPKRAYKPRKRASTTPEHPGHQGPACLRQIQYRSYQHEIQIYHFREQKVSISDFRSLLRRDVHGYVDTLVGTDTLAKKHHFVPEGDEIPENRVEVAYLPNVFTYQRSKSYGCALGFRTGDKLIDWVIFDRPIEDIILNSWMWVVTNDGVQVHVRNNVHPDHPRKLFDHVGGMPKGITARRVKGVNPEHKQWHDSLWAAKLRPLKLKLTWKNVTMDLMAYHAERLEAQKLKQPKKKEYREEDLEDADVDVEMAGGYL